ncbi:ribosome biogenesis ATPase RIX7 [Peziza echinospora]|nr:ribosome biogenesis ATPase RIX7 [Peziza echinospora]
MPPPRPAKPRSLTASLDGKILAIVRLYIENKIDEGDTSVFHKGSLRLSVSQLSQYVTAVGDSSLQRTKKSVVERSIEKAIIVINNERGTEEEGAEDSDLEGVQIADLIEVKDTNAVNKRIVEMWGMKRASSVEPTGPPPSNSTPTRSTRASSAKPESSIPTTPAAPTPAANGEEQAADATAPPKKRKEKSTREGSSKRQKVTDTKDGREPPSNICLADLGGVDDVIAEILELIGLPLTHPEVYTHTGVPPPRGVLLHGPPGCGKTMIANAIAGELGFPFISVSAPSIVSGMSGESEKKLRDLFDEAREKAPCIMFLDEIDAITPKRESAQREMERRIVAQMLTCMDELTLEKTGGKPVMIIGATNRPDSLDPALRRAGRFDREICLGVPDENSRAQILRALSKKLRLTGDFDFRQLAKMTPGFVGADLSALTAAAGVCAIKRIFATLKTSVPAAVEEQLNGIMGEVAIEEEGEEPESAMDLDMSEPEHVTVVESQVEDVKGTTITTTTTTAVTFTESKHVPVQDKLTTLHTFLNTFKAPLTAEELAPLSITLPDFLTALPKIQPSSKREGFAVVPDVTWADIGALESVRVELQMAIVQPIKMPELYASVGITQPTGVLLWGPPGCGKTLLAKAVANESRANFISIRGPELLNKYVGESERAVRQVFSRARASTPCVIFFDELDALVPRRDDSLSDASSRVVNTLLTELDGLSDRTGVFVVGATNRPDVIDPAMLRPGRLDKPLLIDLPTPPERVLILRTLTKKTPLADGIDLEVIAMDDRCRNFSGADLANLVREAAVSALREMVYRNISTMQDAAGTDVAQATASGPGAIKVGMQHFEKAFSNVKPSVTEAQRGTYRALASRFA